MNGTIELEVKVRVASHDAVRERLRERGAEVLERVLETNHIFDNAERTLLSGGCGLRVRSCRADEGDDPPATMTYKGPREPGPLKKREEIEIQIADPTAARTLLERLGFVEVVRFEKRRESWQLADCRIELDEVPYLGAFVEIEGPGEDAIARVRADLGLAEQDTIRSSYIRLLVEHCRANSLPADRIMFTNP